MANQIPSFLSGAKCAIKIGNVTVAFAQNLTFSDDMSVAPVGQIGSFQNQSLEPTGYLARGSITITHYSDHVLSAFTAAGAPAPADTFAAGGSQRDGNSMLVKEFFSPAHMLLMRDFDIEVYERAVQGTTGTGANVKLDVNKTKTLMYLIQGCRFTSYGISFSPGQLVNENLSFISRGVLDARAGELT